MVAPLIIGGIVAGIGIIASALGWAARKRRDIKGSYAERSLEREVGLGSVSRQQRQVQQIEEEEVQEEKAIEAEEEVQEAQTKDEVQREAIAATVESAKASELEEKAEELVAAVESRVMAVEAALKSNTRSLNEFVYATKGIIIQKEQEEKTIEEIMAKIRTIINYGMIDNKILVFLRQYLAVITTEIGNDVKREKKKEKDILALISKLLVSIRIMRGAIARAESYAAAA